jgi:hypothetical protein
MENENTQNLAGRIAALLQESEKGNDDSTFLRASLEKINRRLDNIEERLEAQNSTRVHPSSFVLHPSKLHSSQEKFTNLEELADQIIENLQTEKACPYEPAGKPCDHCAMCSSRGF